MFHKHLHQRVRINLFLCVSKCGTAFFDKIEKAHCKLKNRYPNIYDAYIKSGVWLSFMISIISLIISIMK